MGSGMVALPLLSTGSTAGSSTQTAGDFQTELDERGFTQYQPESVSLNEEGETPDGEGQYTTRVYHKEDLTSDIEEKSDGEITRPGAVFFEQELTGNWEGSWTIDASLGEVSSETQYEVHNTNNLDVSLFKISINLLSPDVDYTKENTTIENQTVGGESTSESLVPPRAISQIVRSFKVTLEECGCVDPRYSAGFWEDMKAGTTSGKTYVAHDDEIDYPKRGYATAHRTYNAEWEGTEGTFGIGGDSVIDGHVDIRGYLSIENRGGESHLAVGGFYINEDNVEFDQGWTSRATEVEVDRDRRHDDILRLMRSRTLD